MNNIRIGSRPPDFQQIPTADAASESGTTPKHIECVPSHQCVPQKLVQLVGYRDPQAVRRPSEHR